MIKNFINSAAWNDLPPNSIQRVLPFTSLPTPGMSVKINSAIDKIKNTLLDVCKYKVGTFKKINRKIKPRKTESPWLKK